MISYLWEVTTTYRDLGLKIGPKWPKSGTRGRAALLINVFFGARKKRVLICPPPHEISENPDRRPRGGPPAPPRKPPFSGPPPGAGFPAPPGVSPQTPIFSLYLEAQQGVLGGHPLN